MGGARLNLDWIGEEGVSSSGEWVGTYTAIKVRGFGKGAGTRMTKTNECPFEPPTLLTSHRTILAGGSGPTRSIGSEQSMRRN